MSCSEVVPVNSTFYQNFSISLYKYTINVQAPKTNYLFPCVHSLQQEEMNSRTLATTYVIQMLKHGFVYEKKKWSKITVSVLKSFSSTKAVWCRLVKKTTERSYRFAWQAEGGKRRKLITWIKQEKWPCHIHPGQTRNKRRMERAATHRHIGLRAFEPVPECLSKGCRTFPLKYKVAFGVA